MTGDWEGGDGEVDVSEGGLGTVRGQVQWEQCQIRWQQRTEKGKGRG